MKIYIIKRWVEMATRSVSPHRRFSFCALVIYKYVCRYVDNNCVEMETRSPNQIEIPHSLPSTDARQQPVLHEGGSSKVLKFEFKVFVIICYWRRTSPSRRPPDPRASGRKEGRKNGCNIYFLHSRSHTRPAAALEQPCEYAISMLVR